MTTKRSQAWSIEDDPTADDMAIVQDGVIAWGRSQAVGGDPKPIACFLREGDGVIAGACGRTEFHRLFVSYLWVSEPKRGQGIGTEALRRLEAAARDRGATDSLIETLDERVARLYRELGYVEVTVIQGYVGEFNKHILVKSL